MDEFEMDEFEVCCDGCDMPMGLGPLPKKLVLCSQCTPESCSTDTLIRDGGYKDIVEQRLKIADEMEKERDSTHKEKGDGTIPF